MTSSKSNSSSLSRGDAFFVGALRSLGVTAGAIVLLIVAFIAKEALPAFASVGVTTFFTSSSWHPTEGQYGLMPMLVGSLAVMAGSVLLATPLGLLSAIFCHFYARGWPLQAYRRLIEMLAGIPSVVYGFWGLTVLVPAINELSPPGASLLAGILILTIMVLPTIAMMADASIASVPQDTVAAAYSLGLDKVGVLRSAVLPAARSGIVTGVILQAGRALGETMAVIMVCGNVVAIPRSFFDPVRTLTANIALEMGYALGDHRAALFASGLLLIAVVWALVRAADRLRGGLHDS